MDHVDPGPGKAWVIIDLGHPELFGQVVSLRKTDLVAGDRALYQLDSGSHVACMSRSDDALGQILKWLDKQRRFVYSANGIEIGPDTGGSDEPEIVPDAHEDLKDLYGKKPDDQAGKGKGTDLSKSKDGAPDDWDDVRTLHPVWDTRGRRHLTWRDVCKQVSEEVFSDWPDADGVRSVLAFCNHVERHSQSPSAWFEQWCSHVGVTSADRVYHEAAPLIQALEWGASYDQLNVASLFSFEILSRRVQVIFQAYHTNLGRPSYEHAPHYNPVGNPFDGVVPELRKQGVQKIKEEAEVERTRQKAIELKHEVDKFRTKRNDGDDAGGDTAPDGKAKGRGRGRGRK